MTALDASFYGEPDRRDLLRWALCLLAILALHAMVVAGLLMRSEPVEVQDISPPAVYVDLPAPEPRPQPASPEAAAPPVEPTPQAAEPAPPPRPVSAPEAVRQPDPPPAPVEQARPAPEPVEVPPVAEATEAPVPLPPPKPRVEPKREPPPREARPQPPRPEPARPEPPRPQPIRPAEPQPRPQPAEPPRGLALRLQPSFAPPAGLPSRTPPMTADIPYQPGSATRTSSIENFQRRLIEHLARYKRYPQSARFRREEGVVRVRFTMDSEGYVLASRIIGSSGYAALDQEVEDLLRRAQPLPPLPPDSRLDRFNVEMPVQFYIWQSR